MSSEPVWKFQSAFVVDRLHDALKAHRDGNTAKLVESIDAALYELQYSTIGEFKPDFEAVEDMLWTRGFGDSEVIERMAELKNHGYADEVECMIYDFEHAVFNNQVEGF
jgi:hypothetical protein